MLPSRFTPQYLKQIELLKLRARRAFLGTRQGGHVSIKRGHGIEFSDYRKYELGDDLRHIDWGVYGRSDKLYVKRFQEEQDLTLLIMIDSSASMKSRNDDGKWEMARDIALSLAYVGLMQQDTVVVSCPGIFNSSHLRGGRAIHRLADNLQKVEPDVKDDFYKHFSYSLSRVGFPGIAVFISDFLFPFSQTEDIVNSLRGMNFETHCIQILSPEEVEPFNGMETAMAVDSETGEELELTMTNSVRADYEDLLKEHREEIHRFLANKSIPFTHVVSDALLEEVIIKNISTSGLLQ